LLTFRVQRAIARSPTVASINLTWIRLRKARWITLSAIFARRSSTVQRVLLPLSAQTEAPLTCMCLAQTWAALRRPLALAALPARTPSQQYCPYNQSIILVRLLARRPLFQI